MAVIYYSNQNVADADVSTSATIKWDTTACGSGTPTVATAGTAFLVADSFVICSPHTLTISAATPLPTATGGGGTVLTVATGGTLAIGAAGKLTLLGGVATAGTGAITVAAGGELAATTLTTAGTVTALTGTTTGKVTLSGALAVGASTTVTLGTGGLLTAASVGLTGSGAIAGTGTVYVLGSGAVGTGTGTGIAGTLKLGDGAHLITAGAATSLTLDTSMFTGGDTITGAGNFAITIPTLTLPAGAANVVTLTAGASTNTFIVSAAPAGGTCLNNSATTAPTYPVTVASATNLVCTPSAGTTVAAPIISTKEKAAVFGQEVK